MNLTTLHNCPGCGANKSTQTYTVSFATHPNPHLEKVKDQAFTYVTCGNCSLLYLNPMVDSTESEEAHASNNNAYVWQESYFDFISSGIAHGAINYAPTAEEILRALKSEGSSDSPVILDIGCGTGRLLQELKIRGAKVKGIEPGPQGQAGATQYGIEIFNGTLRQFPENEQYDAILLMDVIEHYPETQDLLPRIKKLLRPTGKLIINTPNLNSIMSRLKRSHWSALTPPAHVHLWNKKSLDAATSKAGFLPVTHKTVGKGWMVGIANKLSKAPALAFLKNKADQKNKIEVDNFQHSWGGDSIFAVYKLK